jgi:hypothetical protein
MKQQNEPGSIDERMTALALTFHTLHEAAGILPWNPEKLEKWACGPAPGSGAGNAARFILSLWNENTDWKCGRFDFFRAFRSWDAKQKQAFLDWAQDPWWP